MNNEIINFEIHGNRVGLIVVVDFRVYVHQEKRSGRVAIRRLRDVDGPVACVMGHSCRSLWYPEQQRHDGPSTNICTSELLQQFVILSSLFLVHARID